MDGNLAEGLRRNFSSLWCVKFDALMSEVTRLARERVSR